MAVTRRDISSFTTSELQRMTHRSLAFIASRLETVQPLHPGAKPYQRFYPAKEALEAIFFGGPGFDLSSERARLAKAQAESQERRNALEAEELIPADVMSFFLADAFTTLRQRLMQIPNRCAVDVAGRSVDEARAILDGHVRAALAELADEKMTQEQLSEIARRFGRERRWKHKRQRIPKRNGADALIGAARRVAK
jgi:phage terminase Nu1 subunit (DNA packaging protein)